MKLKTKAKKVLPTVHVVDVSNWLYRAFFACAPLTAPDGTPTGAVKSFIQMANKLVMESREDPGGSHVVFVCDPVGKPTWRHKAVKQWVDTCDQDYVDTVFGIKDGKPKSPLYKGTRNKEGQEDIKPQIKLVYTILKAAGFCVLRKAPYEADDICGTIVHRFKNIAKVKVYSRDKDYTQLVDHPNVTLIMAKQANSAERRITLDNVNDFFGVPVENIIDMLALAGDGVDNIPGLPGVGDATAVKLIQAYGTTENLQKNASQLKGKAKYILALNGKHPMMDLDLMRSLVTIDRNVPKMPKTLFECRIGESDDKQLKALKKRLGFKTIFHI